jgi:hypothetical protein
MKKGQGLFGLILDWTCYIFIYMYVYVSIYSYLARESMRRSAAHELGGKGESIN